MPSRAAAAEGSFVDVSFLHLLGEFLVLVLEGSGVTTQRLERPQQKMAEGLSEED